MNRRRFLRSLVAAPLLPKAAVAAAPVAAALELCDPVQPASLRGFPRGEGIWIDVDETVTGKQMRLATPDMYQQSIPLSLELDTEHSRRLMRVADELWDALIADALEARR